MFRGQRNQLPRLKACLLLFWTVHLCCLKKARPGGGYSACRFYIHKCNMFPSVAFSLSELLAVSGINSTVIMDSDLRNHTFCTPYENDCLWLIFNKRAWQGSALCFKYSCLPSRLWDVEQHQQLLVQTLSRCWSEHWAVLQSVTVWRWRLLFCLGIACIKALIPVVQDAFFFIFFFCLCVFIDF